MSETATFSSFKPVLLVEDAIAARVPASEEHALHAFRVYFAVYSVLDCVVGKFTEQIGLLLGRFTPPFDWKHGTLNAVVIMGAVLLCRRKNYQVGAWLLAAYHLLQIRANFPSSGNHRYLELLIYLSIAIVPWQQLGKLLRYAILTIFFYSGLQKALYGYYWSGEIFALEAYGHPDRVAGMFRTQLKIFAGLFGLPFPQMPVESDWSRHVPVDLPDWLLTTFKILGRGALAAEIGLPLAVVYRRTREVALICLLFFSVYIALYANEFEFASTNLACLILFFPRHARWALPVVFVALRTLAGVPR